MLESSVCRRPSVRFGDVGMSSRGLSISMSCTERWLVSCDWAELEGGGLERGGVDA